MLLLDTNVVSELRKVRAVFCPWMKRLHVRRRGCMCPIRARCATR